MFFMKNYLKVSLFCAILFAATTPAFAGDACYTPAQLEAEQLLRLHSELMVITVACRQGSGGEDLVPAYTGFTRNNLSLIHDAEQTLIHFYAARDGDTGVPQLDHLRTRLGNECGQELALISAPVFCQRNRDKVIAFYAGDTKKVENEVHHMVATVAPYGHLCGHADSGGGQTLIAKDTH
jgi:hypothetical protein